MQTISCVLCGEKEASLVYRLPDWQMGRKDVLASFVRCQKCGLVYQNPRPELSEVLSLYPEEYECYQLDMDPRQLSWLKRLSASYGMHKRSQLVLKEKKTGRLLDVGCATGVFLKEMQQHPGWELHGIEPSQQAAEIARKKTGIQVSLGVFEEVHYPDDTFDVITLWDVLEHLPDPISGLGEIQRILKPDGIVVLRVPNGGSWDARLFGKYWAGFEPPRHFFVFDFPVLKQVVEKSGLSVHSAGCKFGGYLTFLLSLRFFLSDQAWISPARQKGLLRILEAAPFRLLAAPFFWLLALNLRGPLLNITLKQRIMKDE